MRTHRVAAPRRTNPHSSEPSNRVSPALPLWTINDSAIRSAATCSRRCRFEARAALPVPGVSSSPPCDRRGRRPAVESHVGSGSARRHGRRVGPRATRRCIAEIAIAVCIGSADRWTANVGSPRSALSGSLVVRREMLFAELKQGPLMLPGPLQARRSEPPRVALPVAPRPLGTMPPSWPSSLGRDRGRAHPHLGGR